MPDVVHISSPTGVVIAADHWAGHGRVRQRPSCSLTVGVRPVTRGVGRPQALADAGHRVVSMDLRGHGDSTWAPDHDYTMTTFRDDALAVADWIGEPITWVGASLGGMSGLHAVDERPDAFRALVLVDITPAPRQAGRRQDPRLHGRQRTGRVRRRSTRPPTRSPRTSHTARARRTCRASPRTCGSARTAAGVGTGTRRSSTSAPAARASTPAMPITTSSRQWRAG